MAVTVEEQDWHRVWQFQIHNDAGDEFTVSGQRGSHTVEITLTTAEDDRGRRWVTEEVLGVNRVVGRIYPMAKSRENGLPESWLIAALTGLFGPDLGPERSFDWADAPISRFYYAYMAQIREPGPITLKGITSS